MRVCFVTSMLGSPWAGSELLWTSAARAAMEHGHEVAVVYRRWETLHSSISDLRDRGATLFLRDVKLDSLPSRLFERWLHPLPAIARWRPDVVCFSLGNFEDIVWRNDVQRFAAKLGAPYTIIVQQHYENQWMILPDHHRRRLVGFLEAAEHVAFVSERNRWAVKTQLATDFPNSLVICNPISARDRTAVPWPDAVQSRLACVARLDASDKGQDLLLTVLADPRWRTRDWVLRLYGDGRHRSYLGELAEHLGLAGRVEFRGHVVDVRGIWADNHLLVLPSRCEGTPIALMETMMWGRPAVVTDVGGNAEWVEEPRNGFVAEAATPRSLAAAMERAWEARARWHELGANAHADAVRLHDPNPERTLLRLLTSGVRSKSNRDRANGERPSFCERGGTVDAPRPV
jgi:glycosyltransferase involved in cell wall biosynthesis